MEMDPTGPCGLYTQTSYCFKWKVKESGHCSRPAKCASHFFLNQRGERKKIKSKAVKKEERKEKKKIKGKEPPVDSLWPEEPKRAEVLLRSLEAIYPGARFYFLLQYQERRRNDSTILIYIQTLATTGRGNKYNDIHLFSFLSLFSQSTCFIVEGWGLFLSRFSFNPSSYQNLFFSTTEKKREGKKTSLVFRWKSIREGPQSGEKKSKKKKFRRLFFSQLQAKEFLGQSEGREKKKENTYLGSGDIP